VNDANEREDRLTLDLLNAIEQQSDVSQRYLARHMGVALGLANSYLKRCARKGLVKVMEAPANRYLYYLTPKGFAEKARLTGQYLANSLTFYKRAAESCSVIFKDCKSINKDRILLYGVSDLAEIATIRATEEKVEIVGICDPDANIDHFCSKPVWSSIVEADEYDICLLTNLQSPYEAYQALVREIDSEHVLVPGVLGIKDLNSSRDNG
jgi:DNA-binding MarR family transcriptional regulator